MRFSLGKKDSTNKPAAAADDGDRPTSPDAGDASAGGGCGAAVVAPSPNGSIDEPFYETRPWLDSDSEDDFHSVRGDFTPSRGSTPDHYRQTPIPVDRLKPPLVVKKQRLVELLQEKQYYDDDILTDASDMENGAVYAEEYLNSSGKDVKTKKSSGCLPSSIWKVNFRSSRNKRKEQKEKVN